MIRARRALALPTVLLILALLGLMAAGTLASLRAMQRSGHLRGADVALDAALLDATARVADGCPQALLSAAPGAELPIDVSPGAVGPVEASALRLSGPLALLHGSIRDSRVGSPAAGSARYFRIIVRLGRDSAGGASSGPICGAPAGAWAWGPSW